VRAGAYNTLALITDRTGSDSRGSSKRSSPLHDVATSQHSSTYSTPMPSFVSTPRRLLWADPKRRAFSMRARGARPALVDGDPAAAWMPRGQLRVVLLFTFSADRIASVEAVAEPERLAMLDLVVAGDA
jgi:hypothetical protein